MERLEVLECVDKDKKYILEKVVELYQEIEKKPEHIRERIDTLRLMSDILDSI